MLLKDNSFFTPKKVSNVLEIKAKNSFLESENKTLKDIKEAIEKSKLPTDACPEEKPYAVKGAECINCKKPTPFFDLEK